MNGADVLPKIKAQGACRRYPELPWFSAGESGRTEEQRAGLRAICQGCPIEALCRRWAINHERYGFWGGMTEAERKTYRRVNGVLERRPERP